MTVKSFCPSAGTGVNTQQAAGHTPQAVAGGESWLVVWIVNKAEPYMRGRNRELIYVSRRRSKCEMIRVGGGGQDNRLCSLR